MRKFVKCMLLVGLAFAVVMSVSCKKTDEKDKGEVKPPSPALEEPGFPVLFSFETDASVAAWQVEADEGVDKACKIAASLEHPTDGKRSLKMTLTEHKWPGTFTTKMPKDWSAYKSLKIDLTVMQDCSLTVRIDDEDSTDYASRFQSGAQDVDKGKTTLEIILDDVAENVNLKKITRLVLFGSNVPADETWVYYIDNIRLEK